MFFDMHADVWTDNFWEYKKGNKDVIRNKYKDKFLKGGLSGGIFVIYLNASTDIGKCRNLIAFFQKSTYLFIQ